MKTSHYIFAATTLNLLCTIGMLIPSGLHAQDVQVGDNPAASPEIVHAADSLVTTGSSVTTRNNASDNDSKRADAKKEQTRIKQESKEAKAADLPTDAKHTSSSTSSDSDRDRQIDKLDRTTRAILHNSAMGLQLGEATGLNLAYNIDKRQQLSGLIGFSTVYSSVVTHLDYLYHFYSWVPDGDYGVALSVFAGGGLRLGFFEPRPSYLREIPFAIGGRIPFGIVASMPPLPMELVLSAAPGFDVSPKVRFHGEASLAVRFFLDPKHSK